MSCCSGKNILQTAVEKTVETFKFTTPQVRAQRMAICLGDWKNPQCTKVSVIKKDYVSMCKVCKCIIEGKTWLAKEQCPMYKW